MNTTFGRGLGAAVLVGTLGVSLLVGPAAYASGGAAGGGTGSGRSGGVAPVVPPVAPPVVVPPVAPPVVRSPLLLQLDWPAAVPLPAGRIFGTTGVRPSETVGILVNGSAPAVRLALIALYRSKGFTQSPSGLLAFSTPRYLVVVATRNHDHSNTKTDVAVWLRSL